MKVINYQEVPSTEGNDINREHTTWVNGKYVSIDEGKYVTLYIGHKAGTAYDEDGTEREAVYAMPVRVDKPVTRDKAINSAEMSAYGLSNAMDVASFNASLARKSRADSSDKEVVEHDEFVEWVKQCLDEIGITSKGMM